MFLDQSMHKMRRFFSLTALVLSFLVVAACTLERDDDPDDAGIDDRPTISAPGTDSSEVDDENIADVPPLFDVVRTESDDRERAVALMVYGQPPVAHMDALLQGNLAVNGECFGVSSAFDDSFVPVVWPADFSAGFENGDAVLIDGSGDVLAREGEPISMGGGNSPDPDGELATIAPDGCEAESYWMSGSGIRRLAPETDPDPAIDNDMTVYFPQWQDEEPQQANTFAGRLVLEKECLVLDYETVGEQRLAIWPSDWSVEADGDDVVLVDESGNEVARTGDIVEVETRFGQFDYDEYGIPAGCVSMHALIFSAERTGGPDDELPEPHVQTPEEAREQDAQMYADRYDVDLDEALRRLDLQSRLGEEGARLERDEADRFGGIYWQHEPEYRLVVLMTDGDEAAVRSYFDDPDLLKILDVRTVEYTQEELHQTQREITELLADLGVQFSSGTYIQENEVRISVADASIVEDALESAGEALPDHVVIIEEGDVETLDADAEGK